MRRNLLNRTIAVALAGGILAAAAGTAGATAVRTSPAPSAQQRALALAGKANFGEVDPGRLVALPHPVEQLPLTPGLVVDLDAPNAMATGDPLSGIAVNAPRADGSVVVVKANHSGVGFGVVTQQHAQVAYRFTVHLRPGTTLRSMPDGSLQQTDPAGANLGRIEAANAVDSTGASQPASYTYDNQRHQLIVRADTRKATGATFIDPSWRCYATASVYGVGWIVAAAAFIFGWPIPYVDAAIVAWTRISYGAADVIARQCALH